MKVPFNLKNAKKNPTSIEAVVRFSGLRFKIASGQSVDPEFWLSDSHRAKYVNAYPEGKQINEALDKLEDKISSAVEYFRELEIKPGSEEFRNKVFDNSKTVNSNMKFADYLESFIENSSLANQTLKNYRVVLSKICAWEKETGQILRFSNVDIHFYRSFEKFIYSQINKHTGNPYSINFFGSMIKIIKKMMNQALADGLTKATGHKHKDFAAPSETADTVYLSVDELYKIHNLKITVEKLKEVHPKTPEHLLQRKIKSYNLVKNLFLIGAFTGLRVSDFNRLEDINFDDDLLRIKTKKTLTPVVVPVHPVVKQILENGFRFSRRVSEQKINKQIKKICQLAEITQKIEVTRTYAKKPVKMTAEKWELVSTHTARRSAATNMFKAGIPSISIMKITGHRTEKSFMKYIKIEPEVNAEILKAHPFFTQNSSHLKVVS
jgi:site-specific recombinase XerD